MKLSIVATLYQSSPHIQEFYERICKSADEFAGNDYEIIFVNDGSPDDSLAQVVELTKSDEHVVVLDLSRNFGHHKAMMTGLEHSIGDHVFLIDSDLEEEPEWLNTFSSIMKENSCDVVYGVQESRRGTKFEQLSGYIFYRLFCSLSRLSLPENIVTARLMSRAYVDALVQHRDKEVFIAGLWCITGFNQLAAKVNKKSFSETTYTTRKKLSILVNSVTSFSNAPLKGIFYIGLTISALSFCYIGYLIFFKIFFAQPLSGWTSIMASIWLLGGMVISFLGVIGIYLSKVFSETKDRPYTIVKNTYKKST